MARLSLDVPHEFRAQLDSVAELFKAGTVTEAVRRSVQLSEVILRHRANGERLLLRGQDGIYAEVILA
jgi:hypothetical protein